MTIDFKDEEVHFYDLMQQNGDVPKKLYHFGGLLVEGQWKWNSDLSDIFRNSKWAVGQPNSYFENEKCLPINIATYNWVTIGFNHINCSDRKGFFCQRRKNPKMPQPIEIGSYKIGLPEEKGISILKSAW